MGKKEFRDFLYTISLFIVTLVVAYLLFPKTRELLNFITLGNLAFDSQVFLWLGIYNYSLQQVILELVTQTFAFMLYIISSFVFVQIWNFKHHGDKNIDPEKNIDQKKYGKIFIFTIPIALYASMFYTPLHPIIFIALVYYIEFLIYKYSKAFRNYPKSRVRNGIQTSQTVPD